MWAKYPKNTLARAVSEQKYRIAENERFTFQRSRCCQNLKFGDFTSLLCREPHDYFLKCVPLVQHDYLSSFKDGAY